MRHIYFRFVLASVLWGLLSPVWAEGLLGLVNPAQRAGFTKPNVAISAHSFDASDYTSVQHYGDRWRAPYTPREGANLAISFARADISLGYKSWAISIFHRQEIFIASSKGLTDMYFNNMNRIQPAAGSTYDISLDVAGFAAQGVRLDKAVVWNAGESLEVTVGVGASALKGQHMRMGQAQGSAMSTANGYNYSVSLHDADSNKTFLYMPQGETLGQGYALDCGMILKWQDGKRLEVAINDLAGEIFWSNLPASRMSVNSATAGRDAQGYTIFNPTLLGVNSTGDVRQRLNPKAQVQLSLPIVSDVTASVGSEWMRGYYFPRLGVNYHAPYAVEFTAGYDTRFKTYSLGVFWKGLYLSARTQSLNLEQSRARGIELGWGFPF